MAQRSVPGPVGTSCLTCRRRHKKCDLRRPTCSRCEQGGFECLGYSHIRQDTSRSAPPKAVKPRNIMPKRQVVDLVSVSPPTKVYLEPKLISESISSSELEVPPTVAGSGNLSTGAQPPRTCDPDPGTFVRWRDRSEAISYYFRRSAPGPHGRRTASLPASLHRLFVVFNRLPSSPSDPILAYLKGPEFEAYVSAHFNRMTESSYFKPRKDESEQVRNIIVSRLRNSIFSRWAMLLCAKICEAIVDGDQSQNALHLRWIDDIEMSVRKRLGQDPAPYEAETLREDWLEITLLRTALGRSSNAYVILRNATPTFLQSVYSLPDLWSNSSDPALIPLLHIIGSDQHALSAFTLMDCTCAMVFGLPQQVEYDTKVGELPTGFLPHEWAHSAPTEFQILLAEINACRDEGAGARDWREIEYVLVHWQAQVAQYDDNWESWMVIAWFAVKESWRLTLLAYLYLAVCGCPSDDERIQRCVNQILQVTGTVKKQEDSDINVPFFIQYLMVGICARSERHRRIILNKLSDANETRFWMMAGAEFIPVLQHLWYGAGSNGRPITWRDYVCSREACLPVPV